MACRGSSDQDFFSPSALGHSPYSRVCLEKPCGEIKLAADLGFVPGQQRLAASGKQKLNFNKF